MILEQIYENPEKITVEGKLTIFYYLISKCIIKNINLYKNKYQIKNLDKKNLCELIRLILKNDLESILECVKIFKKEKGYSSINEAELYQKLKYIIQNNPKKFEEIVQHICDYVSEGNKLKAEGDEEIKSVSTNTNNFTTKNFYKKNNFIINISIGLILLTLVIIYIDKKHLNKTII